MTLRAVALIVFAACLCCEPAGAQQTNAASQQVFSPSRDRFREQFNENALFLMGGPLGQSDIAYASDIAVVVDDGLNLRVLPVVGSAAAQNVKDVLFLRGVDLALTDATTLAALQRSKEAGPALERQVAYISVLYAQEMHVLARSEIKSFEDLRGKKVNFDVAGSGSALHLPDIFQRLGIEVQSVNLTQPDAIEKMRRGELDATVCICAKPVNAFQSIAPEAGFKLIDVPYASALQGDLLPAVITGEDYPGMVQPRAMIDTVATTAVLISFNWPKGSVRYDRTAKFVDAFFSKFSDLLNPPRQPGWRTVNLAASIPGWQRFAPAQEWLEKNNRAQETTVKAEFAKFAAERGIQGSDANPADNDVLFREFLEWKSKPAN